MKKTSRGISLDRVYKTAFPIYALLWLADKVWLATPILLTAFTALIAYINREHTQFIDVFPGSWETPLTITIYEFRYEIVILSSTVLASYIYYASRRRRKKWQQITQLYDILFCHYISFHEAIINRVLTTYEKDQESVAACYDELSKKSKEFLADMCDRISIILSIYTERECHVSVKIFNKDTKKITTHARDTRSVTDRSAVDEEEKDGYSFTSNTAFEEIINDEKRRAFYSNHLWLRRFLRQYKNAHVEWWRLYNATVVVPITNMKTASHIDARSILGFLCTDNRGGGFDGRECVNIMFAFARIYFTIFSLLARLKVEPSVPGKGRKRNAITAE